MGTKVNILFSSFPDYSGNPKALFEYINNNYHDKFNLHWVVYSDTLVSKLNSIGIHCVLYKSPEYTDLIAKINIIFDTNGFLFDEKRPDLVYINLGHGFGPKKAGYLLKESDWAPQDYAYCELSKRKTDFLVVTSEFAKTIYSSIFGVNAHQVLPLGYPRIEYIQKANGKANLKKITNKNLDNYKKIIFYLPTFRNGCARSDTESIFENNLLNLDKYNEKILLDYLKANNYLLIVKKHPAETDTIDYENTDNILVINDEAMTSELLSIHEILNAADMLIADYSSVYVEYLVLDRPILFLHRDIEEYRKNRGIIFDNDNIWFPGPKANDIQTCMNEITKLLTDNLYYKEERDKSKVLMLCPDSLNASKNIFEYIFDTVDFSIKHKPYIAPEDKLENEIATLENTITEKNAIIYEKNKKIDELSYKNDSLNNYIKILEDTRTNLQDQLDLIYNSRSFKIFEFIQKFKHKRK